MPLPLLPGPLALITADVARDPALLLAALQLHDVTRLTLTPSHLVQVLRHMTLQARLPGLVVHLP